MRCDPDQVVVLSGSQQALDLAARLLLDPGDKVWLEDPGYKGAHAAFAGAGANIVSVPLDAEGLDVAEGIRRAPKASLVYVTPSHQFPLGVTMSLSRRLALLEWAREAGAWIIEDDYDSEFRYAGRPLAALQGLDSDGRVIYMGTFSKVMLPSLRMGYLVLPPDVADAFIAARAVSDRHSPSVDQAALAEFITEGPLRAAHPPHAHALRRPPGRAPPRRRRVISRGCSNWSRTPPECNCPHSSPEDADDVALSARARASTTSKPSRCPRTTATRSRARGSSSATRASRRRRFVLLCCGWRRRCARSAGAQPALAA